MRVHFICVVSLFLFSSAVLAGKMTAEEYILEYKDAAIEEMERVGIPASITLAQGMLESGNGNSRLAIEANNHFGIKCHSDWTGATIYKDDDKKNECFRKYRKVSDSYRDHSDFLRNRSRYAFLFELKPDDYKAWAKGLKEAGYATNPKYPQLLIDLIERHELHQYDNGKTRKKEKPKKQLKDEPEIVVQARIQMSANFIKYVVVKEGESLRDIEKLTGVSKSRILKYNERDKEEIVEGEILYLQPKKKSAREKYYTVQQGDNLYQISQRFGVKMKAIIQRNRLPEDGTIQAGQELKLRGSKVKE